MVRLAQAKSPTSRGETLAALIKADEQEDTKLAQTASPWIFVLCPTPCPRLRLSLEDWTVVAPEG